MTTLQNELSNVSRQAGRLPCMRLRSRMGWILFGLCLAFPLVLFLLPASRWVAEGHVRWLFGTMNYRAAGLKESDLAFFDLMGDFYDRPPSGLDRESRLTAYGNLIGVQADYETLTRNRNDNLFVAIYVNQREAETPNPRFDPSTKEGQALERRNREVVAKNQLVWQHLVEACEMGMRMEPKNAFYPATAAAYANALGRSNVVAEYLDRADGCTYWNNHARELTQIYRRVLLKEFGYRGATSVDMARCYAARSRHLIHLALSVAKWPMDAAGVRARRDMIHVANLGYDSDSAARPSGFGAIILALADDWPVVEDWHTDVRYKERVRTLAHLHEICATIGSPDPKMQEPRLREMLASVDFGEVHGASLDYDPVSDPDMDWGDSWWGMLTAPEGAGQNAFIYGIVALSSFLLLLLLQPALMLAGRIPAAPPAAGPGIAAAVACFFRLTHWWQSAEIGICVLFAAAYLVSAFFATRKRWEISTLVVSLVLPPIALFTIVELTVYNLERDLYQYLLFPVILYAGLAIWYLLMRKREPSTFLLVPVVGIVMFGLTAGILVGPFFFSWPMTALLFAIVALFLLTTVASWQGVSFAEAARQLRKSSYWAIAAASVVYGLTIIWMLGVDPKRLAEMKVIENSGARIKLWAHENPDGLLPKWKKEITR